MSDLSGINHPQFTHVSWTKYLVINPDGLPCWSVHVGWLMNYIAFEKLLWEGGSVFNCPGIPIGYLEFAHTFNTGTYPGDTWCMSIFTIDDTSENITISTNPVYINDFFIKWDQCRLNLICQDQLIEGESLALIDYTTGMAIQKRKQQEYYKQHQEWCQTMFEDLSQPSKRWGRPSPHIHHFWSNDGGSSSSTSHSQSVVESETHTVDNTNIIDESITIEGMEDWNPASRIRRAYVMDLWSQSC